MSEIIHGPTTRRARKEYLCGACGWPILRGWPYVVSDCADGGDRWTQREHVPCAEVAAAVVAADPYALEDATGAWLADGYGDEHGGDSVRLAVGLGVDAADPSRLGPIGLATLVRLATEHGLDASGLRERAAAGFDAYAAEDRDGKRRLWTMYAEVLRRPVEDAASRR